LAWVEKASRVDGCALLMVSAISQGHTNPNSLKGGKMKLFFAPGACSMATHIVLNELGFKYEPVQVQAKTKQYGNGQDFWKINPKGYVPALQLENGQVLTEGTAILQYLADQKPEAGLLPKNGSFDRVRAQEWLNFVATEIHKGFSPLWNDRTPEEAKTMFKENLGKRFSFLAGHFKTNAFLLGQQYSVADAYLFTVLNWANFLKIDLSPWPELLGFLERVSQRPAVQATLKAEGLSKSK